MWFGASLAHAEDVTLGASIGAGAQGPATYGALELRLDQRWHDTRLGLGVRGVWDDGVFRKSDWNGLEDLVTIVRDFAATTELAWNSANGDDGRVGHLAIAAGRLAPSHVERIADGYRSTLDDRWRTGIRTAAVTDVTEATLEIDDVLDPALIAGGVTYQLAPPWGVHVAFAVDPAQPAMPGTTRTAGVIEAGASRRFEDDRSRTDLGASIVAELGLGFAAVGYLDSAIAVGETRYSIRADARGGTGTVGSMFGPLYRVERADLWQRARTGELQGTSFGATAGFAAPNGWLELGVRARPGLGVLATASAGAPMGKRVQAALWAAASARDGAGAAELRVAWARRLFSSIQGARIYEFTDAAAMPTAVWSLTAWFGAATN